MTAIVKKQLREKMNNLLEIYNGLKKLQRLKLSDLNESIENIWSVTFGIIAGVEAILDISQYILAEKGIKVESYGKIPAGLTAAKIIKQQFADKLIKMIGFRNRAIHNYPSLDEKQLYDILQKNIDDFKEFLRIMKEYSK